MDSSPAMPPNCPQCGHALADRPCPRCGHSGVVLSALPPLGLKTSEEPPPVRLVREYKGPTVRDLLSANEHQISRLPARMHALERALQQGDYAAADALADESAAALTRHEPVMTGGRSAMLLIAFALWLLALLVTVLWLG